MRLQSSHNANQPRFRRSFFLNSSNRSHRAQDETLRDAENLSDIDDELDIDQWADLTTNNNKDNHNDHQNNSNTNNNNNNTNNNNGSNKSTTSSLNRGSPAAFNISHAQKEISSAHLNTIKRDKQGKELSMKKGRVVGEITGPEKQQQDKQSESDLNRMERRRISEGDTEGVSRLSRLGRGIVLTNSISQNRSLLMKARQILERKKRRKRKERSPRHYSNSSLLTPKLINKQNNKKGNKKQRAKHKYDKDNADEYEDNDNDLGKVEHRREFTNSNYPAPLYHTNYKRSRTNRLRLLSSSFSLTTHNTQSVTTTNNQSKLFASNSKAKRSSHHKYYIAKKSRRNTRFLDLFSLHKDLDTKSKATKSKQTSSIFRSDKTNLAKTRQRSLNPHPTIRFPRMDTVAKKKTRMERSESADSLEEANESASDFRMNFEYSTTHGGTAAPVKADIYASAELKQSQSDLKFDEDIIKERTRAGLKFWQQQEGEKKQKTPGSFSESVPLPKPISRFVYSQKQQQQQQQQQASKGVGKKMEGSPGVGASDSMPVAMMSELESVSTTQTQTSRVKDRISVFETKKSETPTGAAGIRDR